MQGRIQVYLRRDDLGEIYDAFRLMDIGDIIGVEGFVFRTKTGEISIHARSLTLLAKSLRRSRLPKKSWMSRETRRCSIRFLTKS